MLIRVVSDLHLEWGGFTIPSLPTDKETILIDAGDLSSGPMKEIIEHFAGVCGRFKEVIFVPSNHDYYGYDYRTRHKELLSMGSRDKPRFQNLRTLDGDTTEIDGVQFIGATMWSSFKNGDQSKLIRAMDALVDFAVIRYGDKKFRPSIAYELYQNSFAYLKHSIRPGAVVITHNAPSEQSSAPKYRGDPLTYLFCNNLELLIELTKPKLWVHGHTHNRSDYMLGETRVVCNPRGYKGIDDGLYDPNLVITV